jgi:hypothetical protein
VAQEPQNQEAETLKEMQPEHTEAALKVNGTTSKPTTTVEPDESQTTISDHPAGETVEDVSAWPEWYTEEQPEAAGTSSQPPQQKKDKIQIPRSPRKKPATEIVLPRIPEGVQVGPELLGHIGKLKYSDHDVADEAKFLELAKRVFIQTTGTNRVGEPIDQPYQWATGLQKMRILGLLDLPHFGRGQYATTCIKQLLAVTHGGDIWLDKPVPIVVELIANITGLPIRGMDPALFLDDKTKEKALAEEMKKKYDTDRGTRGIIIKRINDAATQLGAKVLACKLLRKCRREEVPAGVVAVAAQCAEGTSMSWASYLLNLFLDDCKDAQDLGTEFHYSWLITLIAFMGWREPRYVTFCTRPKPNQGKRYSLLKATTSASHKRMNGSIFEGYLRDLQEAISKMWRITPEVVARYADIATFQATRHTMWIQARKDPDKQWLQMHYCITEGDIDMVISEWADEWRIPTITQEVQKEQQKKRQSREKRSLRKSKCPRDQERAKARQHRQTKGQRRQGPRRGRRRVHSRPRSNNNRPSPRKRQQQIPTHRNQGETRGQPRRQEARTRNQRHNEHRQNIRSQDDDGEMIARMVQDCLSEDFDHAARHRDKIQEELADMRQLIKQIGEGPTTSSRGINHQHRR